MKLNIKERIIIAFVGWLERHYPTYWEITEIFNDGRQHIHHKRGNLYTPQDIEAEISQDIKNIDDISMIDAERWINIQGLGIRIELETSKIFKINNIQHG